jgi:hypothetical protein
MLPRFRRVHSRFVSGHNKSPTSSSIVLILAVLADPALNWLALLRRTAISDSRWSESGIAGRARGRRWWDDLGRRHTKHQILDLFCFVFSRAT